MGVLWTVLLVQQFEDFHRWLPELQLMEQVAIAEAKHTIHGAPEGSRAPLDTEIEDMDEPDLMSVLKEHLSHDEASDPAEQVQVVSAKDARHARTPCTDTAAAPDGHFAHLGPRVLN